MRKEYRVVVTYADDLDLTVHQLEQLIRCDASVESVRVTENVPLAGAW